VVWCLEQWRGKEWDGRESKGEMEMGLGRAQIEGTVVRFRLHEVRVTVLTVRVLKCVMQLGYGVSPERGQCERKVKLQIGCCCFAGRYKASWRVW
jgi:alpha-D-ribose 1-methylphosphonate 5-triphosphate synthase subunit PhnG